ncbi:hypothetical protein COY93_02675 [Candidatus Uhrbacteria bacterium CG_4_10_14_0_8_um_filter_58_22]|uniref:POTRA domain-containing protein n=1 Tax=Candidatus Uhrbacteria bacterium CG_4_10_14_0_8_um_filter_58_22 TaxID=1975029 RepID=A0A2M7Q9R9_9BACT|nr:MAG: hypothetical protein AUJ19_00110 [Parcubacteria group bacterium CG1_02_58_44]PIY62581.1 MAG: hypothetical protein COY93_02675 [Candidatus Uhrbacteria bacterium CG_4_10_14_0_8_um_filter_58_22]
MKDYRKKKPLRGTRDYSRRSYGNPLFVKQNGKRRTYDPKLLKIAALLAVGIVLLSTGFWYLFWSQSFRISDITIEGVSADTSTAVRQIAENRLQKRRFFVLPQASIFVFDTKETESDITEKFYLNSLEIRKKLPNTVIIKAEEKASVGAFLAKGQFLAIDEDGYVIRELTKRERIALVDLPDGLEGVAAGELGAESVGVGDIDPNTAVDPDADLKNSNPIPLILDWDKVGGAYLPGEAAVSNEILTLVLQAYSQLPDAAAAEVRWFTLDPAADTVDVMLKGGWHVYLTTLIPFEVQAARLSLVLREKIGDRRGELEYVDLRYDERIFFRFVGGDS